MAKYLNEVVGSVGYDNLIIGNTPAVDAVTVTLAAGAGVVERGALVVGTAGGELAVIAGALTAEKAAYVVTDDVDTTGGAVTATAYRCGHFSRSGLKTGGYTLTAADVELLRKSGILVGDSLEY